MLCLLLLVADPHSVLSHETDFIIIIIQLGEITSFIGAFYAGHSACVSSVPHVPT